MEPPAKKYELCSWVNERQFRAKAEQVLEPFLLTPWDTDVTCASDKEQYIHFTLIRSVPIAMIQVKDPNEPERPLHAPERTESLKAWANRWTLNSIPYARAIDQPKNLVVGVVGVAYRGLPRLYRTQDFAQIKDQASYDSKLYEVEDGLHRIDFAKHLGLSCILAEVSESIRFKKENLIK